MELEYGAFSITGRTHKINEDRYRLLGDTVPLVKKSNRGQIFAVFDGMGSAPKGASAAQEMCDCLIHFIESVRELSPEEFNNHLHKTNCSIKKWGNIEGTEKALGACAGTIAWFTRGSMSIFHAGDTFMMLLDPTAEEDTEYRVLTTEHAIGNGISRYFGMGDHLLIETKQFPLEGGEILVLFSDGIIKALGFKTVAKTVRDWISHSPEYAAKELCRLAKKKGSPDDITAVVIEVIDA